MVGKTMIANAKLMLLKLLYWLGFSNLSSVQILAIEVLSHIDNEGVGFSDIHYEMQHMNSKDVNNAIDYLVDIGLIKMCAVDFDEFGYRRI